MIKIINWKIVLLCIGGLLAVLYASQILQMPDTVLDGVTVFEQGDRRIVQVKFNVPVKHEDYFPSDYGEFLQIKVRLVSLISIDKNEYLTKDDILPGHLEMVPISDVAYESNVPGGPFLTLRFDEPVKFQLMEDRSMQSIIISIPMVF